MAPGTRLALSSFRTSSTSRLVFSASLNPTLLSAMLQTRLIIPRARSVSILLEELSDPTAFQNNIPVRGSVGCQIGDLGVFADREAVPHRVVEGHGGAEAAKDDDRPRLRVCRVVRFVKVIEECRRVIERGGRR